MKYTNPWEYYIEDDFLPAELVQQLKEIEINSDNSDCAGTRTGIPGRHFFTPNNNDTITQTVVGHILSRKQEFEQQFGYDLSNSYLRVELAQDDQQQWLEPHLDSLDKRITMIVYIDQDDESMTDLGTDLYLTNDASGEGVRASWRENRCLVFKPTEEKWHGVAKRSYQGRRLVLLINYVNKDTWNSIDQVWDVDI